MHTRGKVTYRVETHHSTVIGDATLTVTGDMCVVPVSTVAPDDVFSAAPWQLITSATLVVHGAATEGADGAGYGVGHRRDWWTSVD